MALPDLKLPKGFQGRPRGGRSQDDFKELESALSPFEFGHFWITDPTSERHLSAIQRKFDSSPGLCGSRIFLSIVQRSDDDHTSAFLKHAG
jgi:hypothetical protein